MPWGVLTPGLTQSWTSGDGVPEVSCATQEARASSRRGAALLCRGPRHGPGLRVGSPGRRGSGVGRAEPGVALTVQDGWMPWGVWVWLSAPTGTWCPVAGDKLCNDCQSNQAKRTTQQGKLPCAAEVSGADSERVGPPETGPRVESLAW